MPPTNYRIDLSTRTDLENNKQKQLLAAKEGYTRYYTGVPCKHGHVSDRYSSTGGCCLCLRSPVLHEPANKTWVAPPSRYGIPKQYQATPDFVTKLHAKITAMIPVLCAELAAPLTEVPKAEDIARSKRLREAGLNIKPQTPVVLSEGYTSEEDEDRAYARLHGLSEDPNTGTTLTADLPIEDSWDA